MVKCSLAGLILLSSGYRHVFVVILKFFLFRFIIVHAIVWQYMVYLLAIEQLFQCNRRIVENPFCKVEGQQVNSIIVERFYGYSPSRVGMCCS